MARILAINANTSPAITELVASHLRRALEPGVELTAVTARFSARYISSEAANAVASHAALDAYARHAAGCDAVLIACFGDPGLFALRELAPQPVVGMAEASLRLAASQAQRYSIVTGGRHWPAMLTRLAAALGCSAGLARVRGIALTGAQIAAEPDAAIGLLAQECCAAIAEDGAQAVILGGAGLAGLAERVSDLAGVAVIDSVVASAHEAQRLACGGTWAYARADTTTSTPSIGLDAALAQRLRD